MNIALSQAQSNIRSVCQCVSLIPTENPSFLDCPKIPQICKSVVCNLAIRYVFLFQNNPKDLDS